MPRIRGLFKSIARFSLPIRQVRFMSIVELPRWINLLVRTLGLPFGPATVLTRRLITLWRNSGDKFFIAYLKECRLALIAWAAKTPYTLNKGVRIRLSPSGMPLIVPTALRPTELSSWSGQVLYRGLHTVFNVYRVMDIKGALPDFSSITNPFTGVSQVLFSEEIRRVCALFPQVKFPYGSIMPWVNTSAGPNHPWSTWSSGKDLFAWALNPLLLVAYLVFAWCTGQRLVAAWLVLATHLVIPFALLLRWKGERFRLGRLSVLNKDGGGKRRIVGIVDFWTQWLLKPLHLYLFDILRKIPQDGTFDQLAPVKALLDYGRLGYPAFSFDLTNATDRLPVALQQQVLTALTGSSLLAWSWKVLLTSRTYYHERTGNIRYAVGQPIGALSSWAMLAITHHVIVQAAAYRTGWKGWYPFYAVLGDDVIILGKSVAEEYLSIMRYLGVPINMGKSISTTNGLIEFAKRLVSAHYGDLSALSARELLRAVRTPRFLSDWMVNVLNSGIFHFPNQMVEVMRRLGPWLSNKDLQGVGRLMIARAYMLSRFRGVCRIPSTQHWADEWFLALLGNPFRLVALQWAIDEVLPQSRERLFTSDYNRVVKYWRTFITMWWKYPLFKGLLGGIFSLPLTLVTPGFWAYLAGHYRGLLYFLPSVFREASKVLKIPRWVRGFLFDTLSDQNFPTTLYGDEDHPGPALPALEVETPPNVTTAEMYAELRSILKTAKDYEEMLVEHELKCSIYEAAARYIMQDDDPDDSSVPSQSSEPTLCLPAPKGR